MEIKNRNTDNKRKKKHQTNNRKERDKKKKCNMRKSVIKGKREIKERDREEMSASPHLMPP